MLKILSSSTIQDKLLTSFIILVLALIIKLLLTRIVSKNVHNLRHRYIGREAVSYLIYTILVILLTVIWFKWFRSVLTALTLVVGALIVVCKELILNLISNVVIMWRGLFDVGDRIQIGTETGDVLDIGPMFITLSEVGNWVSGDESTGRILKIPNSRILTIPVANFTRRINLIWNELTFEVTSDSDRDEAKRIIIESALKHSEQWAKPEEEIIEAKAEFMFKDTKPSVYFSLKEGKMTFVLRYPVPFHHRRVSADMITTEIFEAIRLSEKVKLVLKT